MRRGSGERRAETSGAITARSHVAKPDLDQVTDLNRLISSPYATRERFQPEDYAVLIWRFTGS